jgi:uncharacterized protein with WD repeat
MARDRSTKTKPRGLNSRSGQTPRPDTRPNSKKRRSAKAVLAKEVDVSVLRVVKKPKSLREEGGGERVVDTAVAQALKESKSDMAAKKIKALNKKIGQIDLLREKQKKGETLDSGQLEKVASLLELLETLEGLMTGERS